MAHPFTVRHLGIALVLVGGLGLIGWALYEASVGPAVPSAEGATSVPVRIYAPEPPGNPYFTRHESGHSPHVADPDRLEDCSGCHPSKHPTPLLEDDEFLRVAQLYQDAPVAETGEGLDALLFYGPQTLMKLALLDHPLDDAHEEFLRRELARPGIWIELRVIDSHGVQRVTMPRTFWPFDNKQHYFPGPDELVRLQTPDINGTAKRVGLHHIWVRC